MGSLRSDSLRPSSPVNRELQRWRRATQPCLSTCSSSHYLRWVRRTGNWRRSFLDAKAFSLLVHTEQPIPTRLFLKKSRTSPRPSSILSQATSRPARNVSRNLGSCARAPRSDPTYRLPTPAGSNFQLTTPPSSCLFPNLLVRHKQPWDRDFSNQLNRFVTATEPRTISNQRSGHSWQPTQTNPPKTSPPRPPNVPTHAEVEHRLTQLRSRLPQPNRKPPPTPEQPEPPRATSPPSTCTTNCAPQALTSASSRISPSGSSPNPFSITRPITASPTAAFGPTASRGGTYGK
jgi:hypothetical protein